MRRFPTVVRSLAILLLILFSATTAILLVTHEGRVAIRAAMLIPEVLPAASFRPLAMISEAPLVSEVEYPFSGGMGRGTLYRPAGPGMHGALILFLGINPNYDNDDLQRFAQAVARQGAVVLLVHGIGLDKGSLGTVEVDNLVGSFRFLQQQIEYVNPKRMGFAGFCLGGSLSLLAAGDPRIASDVRFVNSFGGYYSAESLLSAFTTQRIVVDSAVQQEWQPSGPAAAWFLQAVVNAMPNPTERAELERLMAAGSPLTNDQVAGLQPRLRAVYRLLTNRDASAFGPLYQALPDDLRAVLATLAPGRNFPWLQAKVFLMADENDTYVPYTETKQLNLALRDYPRRVFTEFSLFEHMTPGQAHQGLDLMQEVIKLYSHLYLVLLELS